MKYILSIIFSLLCFYSNGQLFISVPEEIIPEEDYEHSLIDHCRYEAPLFPGGIDSLTTYIKKNYNLPNTDKRKRVLLDFSINKDGQAENIIITNGLNPQSDSLFISILINMPRWTVCEKRPLYNVTLPVIVTRKISKIKLAYGEKGVVFALAVSCIPEDFMANFEDLQFIQVKDSVFISKFETLFNKLQPDPEKEGLDARVMAIISYDKIEQKDTLCLGEFHGLSLNGIIMKDNSELLSLIKSQVWPATQNIQESVENGTTGTSHDVEITPVIVEDAVLKP